jgi:uncharacterized protein (DUF4213/DUF364 family)
VEREKQENNVVGKIKRKAKNLMDLKLNCFHVGINYLIVFQSGMKSRDKIGCSISEVMAEVHSIPEITFGDDLYCFATEYLSMRNKREMWASIGDINRKYQWLQKIYQRSQKQ